jgi:hypothetical protein
MANFYIDPIMGNDSADGSTLDLSGLPTVGPKKYMSGLTAANLNDGDEVRMVASPPWNTGTTFTMAITDTYATMGSGFTLADLGVKLVSENNTAWTAATNVTASTLLNSNVSRNLNGTNTSQLVVATAFTTGKMAHIDLGSSTDLSTYNCLNFYINTTAVTNFQLDFCSDSSGDTIIESIQFSLTSNAITSCCLFKSDLSFFPNNVRSIALQATTDPGTPAIIISQMWAGGIVKSDAFLDSIYPNTRGGYIGFNIWSMFGASGMEYFPIRYLDFTNNRIYPLGINEVAITTTLSINGFANYTDEPLYAVCGAPIHSQETSTTGLVEAVDSKVGRIFEGGYRHDGTSNTRTTGHRSYSVDWKNIFSATTNMKWTIKNMSFLYNGSNWSVNFENCFFPHNPMLVNAGAFIPIYKNCIFKYNSSLASGIFLNSTFYASRASITLISPTAISYFKKCIFQNASNNTAVTPEGYLLNMPFTFCSFLNCTFNTTNIGISSNNRIVFSQNHNDISGNHKMYRANAVLGQWQTTEKQGSDPGAWELITSSTETAYAPMQLKLAEFAVNGSGLVTINAWVKKSHATEIDSWILVGSELTTAISQNYEAVSADNTNWQQLQITFTPDEAGVITLYACAQRRNTSNTRSAFFGSINITQA